MLIVGLTGGIGAGKTTVAELLAGHGAFVVDVDGLGHQIIAADGPAVDAVVDRFGEHLLSADRSINRAALAEIVFSDPGELAALNQISHPAINRLIDERLDEQLQACSQTPVAVLDVALLAESGLGRDNKHSYEVVATVEAPHEVRLQRLVERGMTEADALARMDSQATDEEREALADFVVGNGGGLEELAGVVKQMWDHLLVLSESKG